MEKSEFTRLRLYRKRFQDAKRLKGIIIDTKVVPLLKEGTKDEDSNDVLQSVSGLNRKIITNRDRQNVLRLLLKPVKWTVNHRKSDAVSSSVNGNGSSDVLRQLLVRNTNRNGLFFVRDGIMKRQSCTKIQREKVKVIEYINIVRYYIDPKFCLCKGIYGVSTANHEACVSTLEALNRTEGRHAMSTFMYALFSIVEYHSPQDDDGAESSKDNLGIDDAWIEFHFRNYASFEDQLDSMLEIFIFPVVEPVRIGFLQFQTEEGTKNDYEHRPSLAVNGFGYDISVENMSRV